MINPVNHAMLQVTCSFRICQFSGKVAALRSCIVHGVFLCVLGDELLPQSNWEPMHFFYSALTDRQRYMNHVANYLGSGIRTARYYGAPGGEGYLYRHTGFSRPYLGIWWSSFQPSMTSRWMTEMTSRTESLSHSDENKTFNIIGYCWQSLHHIAFHFSGIFFTYLDRCFKNACTICPKWLLQ